MPQPQRGHNALRRGRASLAGQIYLVTTTTHRRASLFDTWDVGLVASRSLCAAAADAHLTLLCWVLMPDHWHGLFALGERCGLSAAMNRVKSTSAIAINRARGASGRVWSRGFHDHAVRRDEDAVAIARYVVLNPVRAGIVRHVAHYPFWDAIWLSDAHRSPASGLLQADPG
jgi:putative transposase